MAYGASGAGVGLSILTHTSALAGVGAGGRVSLGGACLVGSRLFGVGATPLVYRVSCAWR